MSRSKPKSSDDVAGTAKKHQPAITIETKVKIIEKVEQQEEKVTEELKRFMMHETLFLLTLVRSSFILLI